MVLFAESIKKNEKSCQFLIPPPPIIKNHFPRKGGGGNSEKYTPLVKILFHVFANGLVSSWKPPVTILIYQLYQAGFNNIDILLYYLEH